MQFSATQIATLVNGRIEGNPDAAVQSFGKIEEAKAGQLSFLANPKYEEYLYSTGATLIIINNDFELKKPVAATLIRVPDAYSAFATLLDFYQKLQTRQLSGIQQPSHIDPSAQIGNHVFVGAFTYIGKNVVIGDDSKIYPGVYIGDDVVIGSHTILHPGVKIYHQCQLGSRVIIHAGTVVGGDGFGFAPQADGSFKKVPQIGNVVIEDEVEIGANTAIDRATIGSTLIKKGAKLDNLIQIAHNVEIGNSTVIAAQVGISGSTKLGNNVMIGGQAGIVGHIHLADGTRVNGQSGVSKSVKNANTALTGSPAHDYTAMLRSQAIFRNLPDLEKKVKELEKLVQELMKEKVGGGN
jgi:UDP-3-O-[3-hydroxymyristoyl] glucosamine N-acyltransferase